jgi:hypothetical protein
MSQKSGDAIHNSPHGHTDWRDMKFCFEKDGPVENRAGLLYKERGGLKFTMKYHLTKFFIIMIAAGGIGCAGGSKAKMIFYHEKNVPAQYIEVARWTPQEIEFSIWVDFKESHLYHLVLDENNPVAEGWFPTTKTKGQPYTVTLKAKEGLAFSPGKKYRLCVGSENPEAVFVYRSSYLCLADYEFILSEK